MFPIGKALNGRANGNTTPEIKQMDVISEVGINEGGRDILNPFPPEQSEYSIDLN